MIGDTRGRPFDKLRTNPGLNDVTALRYRVRLRAATDQAADRDHRSRLYGIVVPTD
jgi:hypothetical protein